MLMGEQPLPTRAAKMCRLVSEEVEVVLPSEVVVPLSVDLEHLSEVLVLQALLQSQALVDLLQWVPELLAQI